MKNILITIFYADGLHGGVKYSAELGEYFSTLGYNVYVTGVITNTKTQEYFKVHNIHLFNIKDLPTDIDFDIVWAHHFPIVPYLIRKGLKYKYLINSCISNFLPIDRFMFFPENIDMFLTLTEAARKMFISEYNFSEKKIYTFPNMAPDIFFVDSIQDKSPEPHKIAIVSNHPPKELLDAMDILKRKNIAVTVYGGANSVDITPEILSQYDVIVSIGKTVQYALAMGIPVYNYDHFGGSVYININNIDIEESENFSGRSFRTKKSAIQIATEVINQYNDVVPQTHTLKQIAETRYKLSVQVQKLLNILLQHSPCKHVAINNSNRLFFDYCDFIINTCAVHNIDMPVINNKKKETALQRLWRHVRHMKF
ncbi:MAG: hypothetical protein ACI4NZ_02865 [Candidatus Enterousia sp.]